MGPTIDHVDASTNGGSDDINNLRLAHHRCNSRAGGQLGHLGARFGSQRARRSIRPGSDQMTLG